MTAFSKLKPRNRILLYAAIAVLSIRRRRQIYKRKQLKRFWRRLVITLRYLFAGMSQQTLSSNFRVDRTT